MSIINNIKSPQFQFISLIVSIIISTITFTIIVDNRYSSKSELKKEILGVRSEILSNRAIMLSQIVDELKLKNIKFGLTPEDKIKLDNMKDELSSLKHKIEQYEKLELASKQLIMEMKSETAAAMQTEQKYEAAAMPLIKEKTIVICPKEEMTNVAK